MLYSHPFGLQDAFITFKHLWKPDFYTWLLVLCGFFVPCVRLPLWQCGEGYFLLFGKR